MLVEEVLNNITSVHRLLMTQKAALGYDRSKRFSMPRALTNIFTVTSEEAITIEVGCPEHHNPKLFAIFLYTKFSDNPESTAILAVTR